MVVLAIHLKHGVESVFQTLGIKTRRYVSLIHKAAYGFALIVPAAFASIPIYLYVTQL
tara:strand:- start:3676 stop:3849 length:174 start_codon:yes stop_codon:yes gene_type:complete